MAAVCVLFLPRLWGHRVNACILELIFLLLMFDNVVNLMIKHIHVFGSDHVRITI